MTVEEIIKKCNASIALRQSVGMPEENAGITLVLPGKWGKRNTRRLCKGGPVGEIVRDSFDGREIVVFFNAIEVKQFLSRPEPDQAALKGGYDDGKQRIAESETPERGRRTTQGKERTGSGCRTRTTP